jgi:ATP-dependent Clp protease ATP-binding subunit ClpB
MDIQKFTRKSQEALNSANSLAVQMNHQEILPMHLVLALIRQENGFVPSILAKLNVSLSSAESAAMESLRKVPTVTGQGVQTYMSRSLSTILNEAIRKTSQMKDEFTSVEHLFIAALEKDPDCKSFASELGINAASVMDALKDLRGKQRVTSQDPESTFGALEKYARNLTEMARQGKLDPVIGRDEEIRRVIQILSRRTKNNPVLIGDPGVGKTDYPG